MVVVLHREVAVRGDGRRYCYRIWWPMVTGRTGCQNNRGGGGLITIDRVGTIIIMSAK